MAYSTVSDIRKETPFKDSSLIGDSDIEEKIEEADSLIDGYVGKVYTLPLSETPKIIRALSKDITALYIFEDQNKGFEVQPGVSVTDEWKKIIITLKSIQSRSLELKDSNGNTLSLSSRTKASFYPTEASSSVNAPNSTAPKFTMNQKM